MSKNIIGNEKPYFDKPKHLQTEELIKKWKKTGILDNIDGVFPEDNDLVKLMKGKASQLLREENKNKDGKI